MRRRRREARVALGMHQLCAAPHLARKPARNGSRIRQEAIVQDWQQRERLCALEAGKIPSPPSCSQTQRGDCAQQRRRPAADLASDTSSVQRTRFISCISASALFLRSPVAMLAVRCARLRTASRCLRKRRTGRRPESQLTPRAVDWTRRVVDRQRGMVTSQGLSRQPYAAGNRDSSSYYCCNCSNSCHSGNRSDNHMKATKARAAGRAHCAVAVQVGVPLADRPASCIAAAADAS